MLIIIFEAAKKKIAPNEIKFISKQKKSFIVPW